MKTTLTNRQFMQRIICQFWCQKWSVPAVYLDE